MNVCGGLEVQLHAFVKYSPYRRTFQTKTVDITEFHILNSAAFCGGGQGLSWAVEPRKEKEEEEEEEEEEVL
jgi:hypothetical protein